MPLPIPSVMPCPNRPRGQLTARAHTPVPRARDNVSKNTLYSLSKTVILLRSLGYRFLTKKRAIFSPNIEAMFDEAPFKLKISDIIS